jgi:hypothetical protein
MVDLIQQSTQQTLRKVQYAAGAAGVASAVGPVLVGAAVLSLTGQPISDTCAAELSQGLLFAIMSGGGILGGLVTWAVGYFTRERAS